MIDLANKNQSVWSDQSPERRSADSAAIRCNPRHRDACESHRLSKFLLRHGHRQPTGIKAWTKKYLEWIKTSVRFEGHHSKPCFGITATRSNTRRLGLNVIEALQALRGVAQLTAATIVSEIGSFSRFEPSKRMGYSGLVASEHSSGGKTRRGAITKTGNSRLGRVIVEAAWACQRRPWIGGRSTDCTNAI